MVKALNSTKYICEICHTIHPTMVEAKLCQNGHDLIYVPLQRSDLKRLLAYLNSGEPQLLTKSLMDTLNHYSGIAAEAEPDRNRNRPVLVEE